MIFESIITVIHSDPAGPRFGEAFQLTRMGLGAL